MRSEQTDQPVYSSSQRHCHLLLMMSLPHFTLDSVNASQLNGVDEQRVRQDIAEVDAEIQRHHRLTIACSDNGEYCIRGAELDRRLCLLHGLRRALRISPDFVSLHYAPQLQRQLKHQRIATALADNTNLQALINHCALALRRQFSPRDQQLLQLIFRHELCAPPLPQFNERQRRWLAAKAERDAASEIVEHWRKRQGVASSQHEIEMLTLLFSQLHAPQHEAAWHPSEHDLRVQTSQLIARFETLAGTPFRTRDTLMPQLYTHLAQALERSCFAMGIDSSLTDEIERQYPRLLRTTCAALADLEAHYQLSLSHAEKCLVAVIFGAGLMQESALQEKQVVLLTGSDPTLEAHIEVQIREITLLPIILRYQTLHDFQHAGAPKGTALVITPYATPLPLFSPPLIHAELPLGAHQQERIRLLLES